MVKWLMLTLLMIGAARAPNPSPCCFDKEWEANISQLGATLGRNGTLMQDIFKIAFDNYRGIQGSSGTHINADGTTHPFILIEDFANRREYSKIGNQPCTYRTIPAGVNMFPSCIPDNATYLGSETFGYGQQELPFNSWEMHIRLPGGDYQDVRVQMAVTDTYCTPIAQTIVGTGLEITEFFVHYHPGITDRSLVTPPSDCHPAGHGGHPVG